MLPPRHRASTEGGPTRRPQHSTSRRPTVPRDDRPPADEEWRAIAARERRLDGRFVWVALSTSIYCRPSCAARRPRRSAVLVLPTAAAAERQGYLSCARCHPETDACPPSERKIAAALEHVRAHPDLAHRLRTLSELAGLSPSYFHQLFTRLVGLSPRSYCEYFRLGRLKDLLASGRRVSEAAYEAGYGSMRGLYENASAGLGMSPATYRSGASGVCVRYFVLDCALGRLLVALTDRGICTVRLGSSDAELVDGLSVEVPRATLIRESAPDARLTRAVRLSEPEAPLLATLPFDLRRDVFRARFVDTLSSLLSL
jgi:AraC family transcriptional regulator, regulatory protein of adaptative response / methylated-DNA-[protein]-cysteine methyltransferase